MGNNGERSIAERLADHELIGSALTRATREAVLEHARMKRPVAIWEDGRVVWLSPEEVLRRYADEPTNP